MKTNTERSLFNVRPHPGPPPQEREKRSPRTALTGVVDARVAQGTEINRTANAPVTGEPHTGGTSLSLSAGARAGGRASLSFTNTYGLLGPKHEEALRLRHRYQPRNRLVGGKRPNQFLAFPRMKVKRAQQFISYAGLSGERNLQHRVDVPH